MRYEESIRRNDELLVKIQLMESALQTLAEEKCEQTDPHQPATASVISNPPTDYENSPTPARHCSNRKRVDATLRQKKCEAECQLLRLHEKYSAHSKLEQMMAPISRGLASRKALSQITTVNIQDQCDDWVIRNAHPLGAKVDFWGRLQICSSHNISAS